MFPYFRGNRRLIASVCFCSLLSFVLPAPLAGASATAEPMERAGDTGRTRAGGKAQNGRGVGRRLMWGRQK
eukprot:9477328-Pyramimonas_sp.AAC.1